MPGPIDALDRMFAAWNETDASRIRGHLQYALNPDVRFIDPSIDLVGIDDFETNMREVQGKHPGNSYARSSAVDSHHNVHRYHWVIRAADGSILLKGFDAVETDDQGLIKLVMGFFGELPMEAA